MIATKNYLNPRDNSDASPFQDQETNMKIAIIGGGISGLCAAYRLKQAGLESIIFEKEGHAGGRMSSESVNGFIIDKGAYTFPEYHRRLKEFVNALGMSASLVETPGSASTFSDGKRYPVKIGSPTDFLGQKLLSFRHKRDMIKLYLYAQSLGKTLNLAKPTERTFQMETQSAADYLKENFDEEILEKIAYPIFAELFLGVPEHNSKVAFLATLKNLSKFKIFAFDSGMGALTDRLAEDLDVRLDTPVTKIRPAGKKGPYAVEVGGVHQDSYIADAIIFASPLHILPNILNGLPGPLKRYIQSVRYAPSIVVALAVEREYPETSMINSVLRKDFALIGNVVFDRHKSPRRVPEGKDLVTAILCEKASHALFEASEEHVINSVLGEMERLFPGLSSKLLFTRVYRWPYGALQLGPGILSRQVSVRKDSTHFMENLYLAGDGLHRSDLETSFRTGVAAAQQIIDKDPIVASRKSFFL